jgi:Spy/CpxP family protein refolding chaperone
MKTRFLGLVLLMIVGIGVNAQQVIKRDVRILGGPQKGMQMNGGHEALAKALNLTDEQKAAFKNIMLAMHKEILPVRNEIGEAVAHQKTLLSADKPDLAAVNKNIDKIGSLRIEIAKISIKHRLEMRGLLTDEQRLKFDMIKEKMKHSKGQNFRRPGMGMRQGMEMGPGMDMK